MEMVAAPDADPPAHDTIHAAPGPFSTTDRWAASTEEWAEGEIARRGFRHALAIRVRAAWRHLLGGIHRFCGP